MRSIMISGLALLALAAHARPSRAQEDEALKLKAKSRAMALYHAGALAPRQAAAVPDPFDKSAERKTVEPCGDCTVDVAAAFAKSHREGRFLFIWVGGCVETIRREFPGAVHLSVPSWEESGRKRLVIPTTLGDYVWDESRVKSMPQAVIGELRSLVGPRVSAPPPPATTSTSVQWAQAAPACKS